MLTLRRLCVTIFLLLLSCNAVLAQFTISVASLEVAIGQPFNVSWTSSNASNEPQAVDICLNTDTVFIAVASIQRSNRVKGTVQITLNNTIIPTTYSLGIRFPGCSFLLAEEFDDFVVVPA